jgi:hypothetical protein
MSAAVLPRGSAASDARQIFYYAMVVLPRVSGNATRDEQWCYRRWSPELTGSVEVLQLVVARAAWGERRCYNLCSPELHGVSGGATIGGLRSCRG